MIRLVRHFVPSLIAVEKKLAHERPSQNGPRWKTARFFSCQDQVTKLQKNRTHLMR